MKKTERTILVGAFYNQQNKDIYLHSMKELALLSKTDNLEIVGQYIQTLIKPNPATFIGKGKVEELTKEAKNQNVSHIVFNDQLTPTQARNLSKATKCTIIDRTELILDIFAKHARTKQSRLQVKLAQLKYNYSRLKKMWTHLSRIEGGIGFKGPGEKQIELDTN